MIKIISTNEEYNKAKCHHLIKFECSGCKNIKSTEKFRITQILKGQKNIYCSHRCYSNDRIGKKSNSTYNEGPKKEQLEKFIKDGLTKKEIAKFYPERSVGYVQYWLRKYGLKTIYSNGSKDEVNRKRRSETLKKFLKEHPDHPLCKHHGKNPSIPCEKLKEELRKRGIKFEEEILPLIHLNHYYRVDILMEQYGTIIEVNGPQHYNDNGKLTDYYQIRHDLLVKQGWRVFEIPAKNVFANGFIDNLLIKIYDGSSTPNFEYKKAKEPKFCQCGKKISRYASKCKHCAPKDLKITRPYVDKEFPTCPISKPQFHWLLWNDGINKIYSLFKIRERRVKRWIKEFGFKEIPTIKYRIQTRFGLITDYQI